MSPLRLSKSSLTIDFEVFENGNSSEQRLKFVVDRVEREVNNPHPVTLQKAIRDAKLQFAQWAERVQAIQEDIGSSVSLRCRSCAGKRQGTNQGHLPSA